MRFLSMEWRTTKLQEPLNWAQTKAEGASREEMLCCSKTRGQRFESWLQGGHARFDAENLWCSVKE